MEQWKTQEFMALEFAKSGRFGRSTMKLADIERQAIFQALTVCNGNVVRAAQVLDIGKTTIYRKLAGYGIPASDLERINTSGLPLNPRLLKIAETADERAKAPVKCPRCRSLLLT